MSGCSNPVAMLAEFPFGPTRSIMYSNNGEYPANRFSKRRRHHLNFRQMTDGRQGPACDIFARRITYYRTALFLEHGAMKLLCGGE